MFGWEFPPHILGGLGTASYGLTKGMWENGDMDITVLDELPRGRQPVETYLVDASYRPRLYRFLEKHFQSGQQGYIICPLVEEGGAESALIPAEEYYEYLQKEVFPNRRIGLLHGKMKSAEKDRSEERAVGRLIVWLQPPLWRWAWMCPMPR